MEDLNQINQTCLLDNIKSIYILKKLLDNIQKFKSLSIFKYNKKIQKRLNLTFDDFEEICKIEIELKPLKFRDNEKNIFINIAKEDESYYHIYFNNNEEEIERK